MKKRILASLLSLCLLVGLFPATALAVDETQDGGEPSPVCTCEALCTEEAADENCPVCTEDITLCAYEEAPMDEGEPVPCTLTEGCTLENGHEGECVTTPADPEGDPETPAEPMVVEQLQARINALPGADVLAEMDEAEQAEVYAEVSAIYDAVDALTGEEAAELDVTALEEAAAFFTQQIMPLTGEDTNSVTSNTDGGISWSISGNTLTISPAETPENGYESGEMKDYPSAGDRPWKGTADGTNVASNITTIVVNEGVTKIGYHAFHRFESVTSVSLPDGLQSIGVNGFSYCISLETLTIPSSVEMVEGAFPAMQKLTAFSIENNASDFLAVKDGVLYNKDETTLLAYPAGKEDTSYEIASTVTKIGKAAFQDNDHITQVTIPDGVKELGENTFFRCDALTSLTIPSSIVDIPKNMCSNCKALNQVTLSEGIKTIGEEAFKACPITSIQLPQTLTEIRKQSFFNTELTEINIPDSVVSIGEEAFKGASNDTLVLKKVVIGTGLKTVGNSAFVNQPITHYIVKSDKIASIGNTAFAYSRCAVVADFSHQKDSINISAQKGSGQIPFTTLGSQWISGQSNNFAALYVGGTAAAQSLDGMFNMAFLGNTNGGTFTDTATFSQNSFCSELVREGYTPDGWYDTNESKVETPSINQTYNFKWLSTITFDANGGSLGDDATSPITVAEGKAISTVSENYALPTPTNGEKSFAGWNTAKDGSGTFVTTSTVPTGDMTVYAIWGASAGESGYTLLPIEDQTYTGSAIEPTVYMVDSNGIKVAASSVTYENNTNAGTATAKVTVSGTKYSVNFTIVPKLVTKPEADSNTYTYTGSEQTYIVAASDDYAVTGNTMTNAGSQTVTVALKDPTNTKWADSSTDDVTFTFTIGKATYNMSGVSFESATYIYDGTEKELKITGTLPEGVSVSYTNNTLTNVGSTTATATFTGDDTNYEAISDMNATLTITAASSTISITANNATSLNMTGSGTVTLTVSGVPEGGAVTVVQTDDQNSEAKTLSLTGNGSVSVSLENKTAKYTFTVSFAGNGNQEGATASCEVSVTRRSSGGGSSGGSSSSSNTTTETTKNSDGSTTTTVTNKTTGTVTETTRYTDGSTLVVETKKDGTVTTTETTVDKVVVKTVDEPGEDVTATVTIPRSVGTATVTIPADTTPGTVAVDVKTGEVVKLSVPTEDGVTVKLDGSADLVLVDKSKDFTDTRNHWAEDAIDFATAHGMFGGTSDTTFSPDRTMTRGMIAVVLHNLENNPDHAFTGSFDDVHPDSWYADGIYWMVDNGIAGGYGNGKFGAEDKITREQLATFLYRYAGAMGYGTSGSSSLSAFTDAGSVSGYATEAMQWAVGNGLIGGMGDGTLAPQGNATRAQVATILMRFIENLTK